MIAKKLLGDMVKEERQRRNLSQNALAEQAKISLRTVCDIENYKGNPQFDTLCALATFLNISIDAIIKEEPLSDDATMHQIMSELSQCSPESKHVALCTLRGLLSALHDKA